MDVTVLLAESGVVQADGTFSALRVGIRRLQAPSFPCSFVGCIIVMVHTQAAESGSLHTLGVRITDLDGHDVAPRIQTQFQAPKGEGSANMLLSFVTVFQKAGRYTFAATIDGKQENDWVLDVREIPRRDSVEERG